LVVFWLRYSFWAQEARYTSYSYSAGTHLLHELLILVGNASLNHPINQSVLRFGQGPVILQQILCLPFDYFSDPALSDILFPTLIAACYNDQANRAIVEEDLSLRMLGLWLKEKKQDNKFDGLPQLPKHEVLWSVIGNDIQESNEAGFAGLHDRMKVENRLPKDIWDTALEAFLDNPCLL
jgi:hypothetical protein